jgi:hypothetical protein
MILGMKFYSTRDSQDLRFQVQEVGNERSVRSTANEAACRILKDCSQGLATAANARGKRKKLCTWFLFLAR